MAKLERLHLTVPCYIYQYLKKEYGPDPHLVSSKDHTVIRNALLYQGFYADVLEPTILLPTTEVLLIMHVSTKMYRTIMAGRSGIPSNNYFFQFEFYQSMDAWCEGLRHAAGMTRRAGLRAWLEYYAIDESILPEDHAYRYLTFFRNKRQTQREQNRVMELAIKQRPASMKKNQLRMWDHYLAEHRRAERQIDESGE